MSIDDALLVSYDHVSYVLLTDVHLADKIMKTKWDTAGGGAQVVAGAEVAKDLIPTNRWLKRVVLPGRVEFMRMSLDAGRKPTTGHEEGAWEPIRFYV